MTTTATNIIKTMMLGLSFALFIAAAQIAQGATPEKDMVNIAVVVTPIKRGDVIGRSDISVEKIKEQYIRSNTLTTADELIGKEATRNLRMGYPVSSYMVRTPATFKRGATVPLVFQRGSVRLIAEGKAMQEGNVGEWVRIQNLDSGAVIQGLVQENGTVVVN